MDTVPKLMDHNKRIEELCSRVEAGHLDATSQLCEAWHRHARMDIELVYPSLPASNVESAVMAARAQADRRLIDRLVEQIERTQTIHENNSASAGLLVRLIREHVIGEELSVFPVLLFDA